jgi:hypothetical protein
VQKKVLKFKAKLPPKFAKKRPGSAILCCEVPPIQCIAEGPAAHPQKTRISVRKDGTRKTVSLSIVILAMTFLAISGAKVSAQVKSSVPGRHSPILQPLTVPSPPPAEANTAPGKTACAAWRGNQGA